MKKERFIKKSILLCLNEKIFPSDYFENGYMLDKDVGIILDSHIRLVYLSRVCIDNCYWYVYDNELYLGDTWNSTDEEILSDIQNMNYAEFAQYYHLY